MKDKIQIVSWLLTRKCNLQCSYCAIVRNYKNKPDKYPDIKHYIQNEMKTDYVIEMLRRLKLHNPEHFNIFYGGEPTLRNDLADIINYCNKENINYTIISNNTEEVQPLLEKLMLSVDYITGYTASIDPLIVSNSEDKDRIKKSTEGLQRLLQFKGIIKDLVAEITVDNRNVPYLYQLVKQLTEFGINSDITFVDIAKSPYYDFSNVTDESLLVHWSNELESQLQKIASENLDCHMIKELIPEFKKILPANMNCTIEDDCHNITIDADGTMRTCLRLRGIHTPSFTAHHVLSPSGILNKQIKTMFKKDKDKYCRGCNWTCLCMSSLLSKQQANSNQLIHSEKRNNF